MHGHLEIRWMRAMLWVSWSSQHQCLNRLKPWSLHFRIKGIVPLTCLTLLSTTWIPGWRVHWAQKAFGWASLCSINDSTFKTKWDYTEIQTTATIADLGMWQVAHRRSSSLGTHWDMGLQSLTSRCQALQPYSPAQMTQKQAAIWWEELRLREGRA